MGEYTVTFSDFSCKIKTLLWLPKLSTFYFLCVIFTILYRPKNSNMKEKCHIYHTISSEIWRKKIMRVLVSWQKVKNINLKKKIMLVSVSWRKVKKITSDKIGGGAKISIILFCFWLRLSCYALSLPSSPSHFPSYLTLPSLADIFSNGTPNFIKKA